MSMSTDVFYYSKGGNTEMLANALSKELGVTAKDVSNDLVRPADIVFLGASVYAGSPAPEVTAFLKRNADKIGKLVVFGSSASGKTVLKKLTSAGKELGIEVMEECFSCPGHFLFMHKGRPNQEDLENLQKFARNIIQK